MWDLEYNDLYKLSVDHPDKYWDVVAKDVVWNKPYTSVLEEKDSQFPKWYVGGEINMSYNCLDRQVEDGYGDDVAVIHDSPVTGTIQRFTYNELLESVQLLAGVMSKKCGVSKGDRVLLYFPMIPQCLIAMLACARIGAIYTPVFGGFASNELASRIRYFEPKLILAANVGMEPGKVVNYKEKIDDAIVLSGCSPEFCIIYNRPNYAPAILLKGRDLDWIAEISVSTPQGITPVESDHPLFVIFTSGTTGAPKGIVKFTGGLVVSNKYGMSHTFGLKPGEVWWTMSDFAWIIGQTCGFYGPLMSRNPTIIYEGKVIGTPDSCQITRILNTHRVVSWVTVPTVMKLLREHCSASDLELKYGDLRAIICGGEVTDLSIRNWMLQTYKCPVYNVYSQSELASGILAPGLGFKGSENSRLDDSIGLLMPSFRVKVVDRESGSQIPADTIGRVLLQMPINPASAFTLFKDSQRCIETYFSKYPGYYDTMDAGLITKDGLLKIVARDDDIINVGAIRVCSGEVEEACLKHELIIDVAVVPLEDPIKGHIPFAFLIVKKSNSRLEKDIIDETFAIVLEVIGDFVSFNKAVVVPCLPKTKSGKTPKFTLADMINGRSFKIPSTVDNPGVYLQIHEILVKAGYSASLPSVI